MTIFDLDDNIVYYEIYNPNDPHWFDGKDQNGSELPYGSYKYKVVIENENSFVQYGYFCFVRKQSEANEYDISNCVSPDGTTNLDTDFDY